MDATAHELHGLYLVRPFTWKALSCLGTLLVRPMPNALTLYPSRAPKQNKDTSSGIVLLATENALRQVFIFEDRTWIPGTQKNAFFMLSL